MFKLDITFDGARIRKACSSQAERMESFGPERARRVRRRLDDLVAAPTLADMRGLPGRCHEMREDRAGHLSLDLDGPYRLIFKPAHDPVPAKPDGGLDWSGVTAVSILEVRDTHE